MRLSPQNVALYAMFPVISSAAFHLVFIKPEAQLTVHLSKFIKNKNTFALCQCRIRPAFPAAADALL